MLQIVLLFSKLNHTSVRTELKYKFREMDTENKDWKEILAECSIREARIILMLQYLLYVIYSRLFFFLFLFIIVFGISINIYLVKGVPYSILIAASIIHYLLFLVFDKIMFKDRQNEMLEIRKGIEEIKNYIKTK